MIDVDAETMLPINWRIYAFDVATANESGSPYIYEMINYSKDYFGGAGLSPDQMLDLTNRVATDSDLYWQINWDRHRRVGEKKVGTDAQWQAGAKRWYCLYTSSSHEQQKACDENLPYIPGDITELLIGKWKELQSVFPSLQ